MRRFIPAAVAALTFAAVPAASLQAQLPIPSFGIAGGVSHYDLPASGSTPFGALRVDVPLFTLIAEGSVGVMRPDEGLGSDRTYLIPEAQLQWQLLPVLVRPYIGVGAGWFDAVAGTSPHTSVGTLSASAGIRVTIPLTGIGVRAEARTRSIGGVSRRATEWTLGASW